MAGTKSAAKKPIKKSGLGKGLDSLIPKDLPPINISETPASTVIEGELVQMVSITKLEPDREQPRKTFNEDKLNELAESIKKHNIIEPLIVQDMGDRYEIVAGERRWRAARIAGLKEIPVVIKKYTQQQKVEISLIENIQREELNAIEEAFAYKRLMNEFNLTQEQVAERIGKKRTTIANSVRLLNLADEVQQMIIDGSLTPGHARSILTIEDKEKQVEIALKVVAEKLTVRDIEKFVKNMNKPAKSSDKPDPQVLKLLYKNSEDNLRTLLGTKTNIVPRDEERGKIEIEYYSKDELNRILDLLMTVDNN